MVDSASDPFILVVSGPRSGAGRTSLVVHLAIALLRHGIRTGVVDFDLHAPDLTRFLKQRDLAADHDAGLVMPAFPLLGWTGGMADDDILRRWPDIRAALKPACSVIIIDAPAGTGLLAARLHQDASQIITVVPESASEIQTLFALDETGSGTVRPGAYVRMIWEARARGGRNRGSDTPWMLLRSRSLAEMQPTAVSDELQDRLDHAQRFIGAGNGPTLMEHPAWRLGNDEGLTLLDPPLDRQRFADPARAQLRACLIALKLPHLQGMVFQF
jgi:chromosome partitioning protein